MMVPGTSVPEGVLPAPHAMQFFGYSYYQGEPLRSTNARYFEVRSAADVLDLLENTYDISARATGFPKQFLQMELGGN